MTNHLTTIDFYGVNLLAIEGDVPEKTLVAMKPMVDGMGLDWSAQFRKANRNHVINTCIAKITIQVPGDIQAREHIFIPLNRVHFWLATLEPNMVAPECREAVIRFQTEAADVLFNHFFGKTIGRQEEEFPSKNEIGGVVKRVLIRQLTDLAPAVMAQAIRDILPELVKAEIASHTRILRNGKTAGEIWREYGFPRIRVGGWFGNKLEAMGCQIDGNGRGELGLTTARMFDPDKARQWLKNGGEFLVRQKIAERQGQGKLHLVVGKGKKEDRP